MLYLLPLHVSGSVDLRSTGKEDAHCREGNAPLQTAAPHGSDSRDGCSNNGEDDLQESDRLQVDCALREDDLCVGHWHVLEALDEDVAA